MHQEAIAEFEKVGAKTDVAYIQAIMGNKAEARKILKEMEESKSGRWKAHCERALVRVGLQETDAAIAELELAERDGEPFEHLNVDSRFDPLRKDPRYPALLRRHGFSL